MIVVLILSFSIYKMRSQKVEYEVLNIEDVPVEVQNEMLANPQKNGFSIHSFENYTYVFYRLDHKENEYISTELSVHKKKDEYIITSLVDWATNDHLVSYEKVMKFEKVSEEDIVLKEKDKR